MASSTPKLVAAARCHAPEAWDTLLKQYQTPLYAYAAELLGDRDGALDVVQDTFTAAVRHIGSLRDDARFGAWLFGIAHQKCVQRWRQRSRRDAIFVSTDAETIAELPDPDVIDPRTTLLRREQADEFFAVIAALAEPHRAVLLLHIVEEFSIDDIAEITAAPAGTVKSRLFHAKRALRQRMETFR